MNQLEQEFERELTDKLAQAQIQLGVSPGRMPSLVEKGGAVGALKQMIARRQLSDSFETLCGMKRLDLSVEALVTAARYSELFTDEEVNACFETLCEADYFG